jgi:hypothetical protein
MARELRPDTGARRAYEGNSGKVGKQVVEYRVARLSRQPHRRQGTGQPPKPLALFPFYGLTTLR